MAETLLATDLSPLDQCLDWLRQLLILQLKRLKGDLLEQAISPPLEVLHKVFKPHLSRDTIDGEEGLLLALALFPHIQPQLFDRAIQEVFPQGGNFPELGGLRGTDYRGFLPTGFTALYLFAGDDLAQRFHLQALLSPEHWLIKTQTLKLTLPEKGAPLMSGLLILEPELVEKIILGRVSRPVFSAEFPAAHISTKLSMQDLVLPEITKQQIDELIIWLDHRQTFLHDWQLQDRFKPGYRVLFHGPPGTGKTLTASILGNLSKRDVFKVDLSTIVSKYIGETEKNLSSLFDRAENKNWILFFDEADALFGKRTQVQNAHDRYANQEVSYLLQRIESFDGLIILASNFKNNIDEAFLRRFQALIHFPMPNAHERFLLWSQAIPTQLELAPEINLKQIAQKFELTGADVMNIVQYVALKTIHGTKKEGHDKYVLSQDSLLKGIRQELIKSNKLI
jgi:AAA+ superfamily predicted ATPase